MTFIRRHDKEILDTTGKPFLLKGVGLGSWLLPEGYMWQMPAKGDRPRRIEAMVRDVLQNQAGFESFWDTYRRNYINHDDIKAIKNAGFNSIRLPFNSRNLLENPGPSGVNEKEMAYIDIIINLCRKEEVYVILDMHGAPGGQTGANIDDSEKDLPELFIDEKYKGQALWLWQYIANKYKGDPIIAGYDLLNEPIPDFHCTYNDRLIPMYKAMIEAIRQVDPNHMIILEGLHWATDISVFTEILDDNTLLQFHKYWNKNDVASIQKYLDKREELNLPIFMGEGGENDNTWYQEAFRLLEAHDISWNFWTFKKMGKTNSPYRVDQPEKWHILTDYLEVGVLPDPKVAKEVLWQYLENLKLDNCQYYPDVITAVLGKK